MLEVSDEQSYLAELQAEIKPFVEALDNHRSAIVFFKYILILYFYL